MATDSCSWREVCSLPGLPTPHPPNISSHVPSPSLLTPPPLSKCTSLSDADFESIFFLFYLYVVFFCCPFVFVPGPRDHCQHISPHSCAADSVFMEHSICCEMGGVVDGEGLLVGESWSANFTIRLLSTSHLGVCY